MKAKQLVGLCAALATVVVLWVAAGSSEAAVLRRNGYRAPIVAQQSRGGYSSQGGWNASNTWYTHPNYGNYAPPPYATSKRAFYQVGPVPAPGGVRSLPGWGGAR